MPNTISHFDRNLLALADWYAEGLLDDSKLANALATRRYRHLLPIEFWTRIARLFRDHTTLIHTTYPHLAVEMARRSGTGRNVRRRQGVPA